MGESTGSHGGGMAIGRHARVDSHTPPGRERAALAPPEGLAVICFTVGSDDYALLTFDVSSLNVQIPKSQGLTETELAIVTLILAGHSNAEIARTRGTSPSTIANQVYAIYRKLGVRSRRELRAIGSSAPVGTI
ncbi:MAG TPA: DNA-binding response regulator [Polyangiaceae bacterium]|nr:DNA-binding response regulator [Polyangiaceae bacterium]